jgi:hypothetical protein
MPEEEEGEVVLGEGGGMEDRGVIAGGVKLEGTGKLIGQ